MKATPVGAPSPSEDGKKESEVWTSLRPIDD